MKFSDLLGQGYDERTEIIYANPIRVYLPETPLKVIEQVYCHHGRKDEFQRQYGELNLSAIAWTSITLPASEIIKATIYEGFMRWFRNVESRTLEFAERGWQCIDKRKDVISHWSRYQTWSRPPVFIQGLTPGVIGGLHLMEGHTRVGLLRGLVKDGVLSPLSRHKVFVGRVDAPNKKLHQTSR
ncbi:hypothetical protein MOY_00350 [Halomonas sp. GFAJ-1]|nr:hypothetical protein BB497_11610 [Halomonas sp. GFAJ-1]EHK62457.1 hypothetical protein MOY_00350 [Halomonas sp. GFAJ-1]